MKVECSINKIIVYIFSDKYLNKKIENVIKEILLDLNKYYGIELKNSYELRLYTNKYYGMILEITELEDVCKKNIVNLNLKILKDSLFLFEVEDPLNYIDNEIYYYDERYFINSKKVNINLFENSNIVYGKDAYKILGNGIKLS